VRAGETINIPANAPHSFTNRFQANGAAAVPLRCRPGKEAFFVQVGVLVATHMTTRPNLDKTDQAAAMKEGTGTCTRYRMELS
jgi:hypothetical protein